MLFAYLLPLYLSFVRVFVYLFTFSFVTFSLFHCVILYLSVLLTRFEAFLSHQLFFLFVYCIYKLSPFLSSADLSYSSHSSTVQSRQFFESRLPEQLFELQNDGTITKSENLRDICTSYGLSINTVQGPIQSREPIPLNAEYLLTLMTF